MMDCIARISKHRNGYEISITDPKIVEANRKRDNAKKDAPYVPWRDPQVSYVFKSVKELVTFLTDNLEKAVPTDEFSSSFDKAAAAAEED